MNQSRSWANDAGNRNTSSAATVGPESTLKRSIISGARRFVNRDLEVKRVLAESYRFGSDIIKDRVLVNEDAIGYGEVLLQVKVLGVSQWPLPLHLFAVIIFFLLSHVLRFFTPLIKIAEFRDRVRFAVLSHLRHCFSSSKLYFADFTVVRLRHQEEMTLIRFQLQPREPLWSQVLRPLYPARPVQTD